MSQSFDQAEQDFNFVGKSQNMQRYQEKSSANSRLRGSVDGNVLRESVNLGQQQSNAYQNSVHGGSSISPRYSRIAQIKQLQKQRFPSIGKQTFLRRGDRNKAMALSMIKNGQKLYEFDVEQYKKDVYHKEHQQNIWQSPTPYSKVTKRFQHFGEILTSNNEQNFPPTAKNQPLMRSLDFQDHSTNIQSGNSRADQVFRSSQNDAGSVKHQRLMGLQSIDSAIDYLKADQFSSMNIRNQQQQGFHEFTTPSAQNNQNFDFYSDQKPLHQQRVVKNNHGYSDGTEFNENVIKQHLKKYLKNEDLEMAKNFQFTRKTFSDFIKRQYDLTLSQQLLTEAIIACRGIDVDNSDPKRVFDLDKLINWMQQHLPSLYTLNQIKKRRDLQKMMHKRVSQDRERQDFEKFHRPNVRNHIFGRDSINNSHNLGRVQSLASINEPHISKIGKSMFIINNDANTSHGQVQLQESPRLNVAEDLKNQISMALDEAEKKPSQRKKLLESIMGLEDQLNEIRAEEGYLAQMKAQQRLRDTLAAKKEKQEKDLEQILERTAVLDSAVRAVGLQKILVPSWNEEKNSYVIMSKLTEKQKTKLNDLAFNRYN